MPTYAFRCENCQSEFEAFASIQKDKKLISMARRYNYIPRKASVEQDYALALRQAYADYLARQSKKMQSESIG